MSTTTPKFVDSEALSISEIMSVRDGEDFEEAVWAKIEVARLLSCLTPRQERVIRLYFGIGCEPMPYAEIAAKEFGVSRVRVQQIAAKAFRKMRHPALQVFRELRPERRAVPETPAPKPISQPITDECDPFIAMALLADDQYRGYWSVAHWPWGRLPIKVIRGSISPYTAAALIFPMGPRTLGDLADSSARQLMEIPGFDQQALREVTAFLLNLCPNGCYLTRSLGDLT